MAVLGLAVVLGLAALFGETRGHNAASCPVGWIAYTKDAPFTCIWVSDGTLNTLDAASKSCGTKNASLIVMKTEAKFNFFKEMINKYLNSDTPVWVGLKRYNSGTYWLTKNGQIEAENLPTGLRFHNWVSYSHRYKKKQKKNMQGLFYVNNRLYRKDNYGQNYARYYCEKESQCKKGWYGPRCDKECHCHGQECATTHDEVTCIYGCKVGWMGKSCDQPKVDAAVSYFCVDSPDSGKYAHVRIDTKGIDYENIHATNENGHLVSWCNNTVIETSKESSTTTIKIYINNETDQDINDAQCAGKITDSGHYEWRIKIQEFQAIVSRNDQEVFVDCDFTTADKFSLSGEAEIKREKWFRRNGVKKPVEYLKEKKEKLELDVVDPATGEPVSEPLIGSPVMLRVRYALAEGNVATGINPYNCDATSSEGELRVNLLDKDGCRLAGSPVSEFTRNSTKSLMTEPFPLFGFDGTTGVHFHCSYTLCFDDDDCRVDCHQALDNETSHRYRRSAGLPEKRLTGIVEIVWSKDDALPDQAMELP